MEKYLALEADMLPDNITRRAAITRAMKDAQAHIRKALTDRLEMAETTGEVGWGVPIISLEVPRGIDRQEMLDKLNEFITKALVAGKVVDTGLKAFPDEVKPTEIDIYYQPPDNSTAK